MLLRLRTVSGKRLVALCVFARTDRKAWSDFMNWKRWYRYLFPNDEQEDPAFRKEILRLAVVGLRIIAGITFSIPLLMLVIRGIVPSLRIPWGQYVTYPILADRKSVV